MKILYLAPPRRRADRLTAFTFVDEEIIALARTGVEVHVLTYPLQSEGRERTCPGVYMRPLRPGRSFDEFFSTLRALWRCRRLIPASNWLEPRTLYHAVRIESFAAELVRNENIDVIHSNFGWTNGYGGVLTRFLTGTPLVATMRGMDVLVDRSLDYGLRLSRSYDRALRVLLANADATTHVSDFIRTRAIELGATKDRTQTIRKGVNCEHFEYKEKSDAPSARLVVLTVAGLIRRKGVDDILRALALLRDSHEFSFVVAGSGPEADNLRELGDRLGLGSRTSFLGHVDRDQIQDLYAECDVFVLGSIWEGSGNVLLEALASGRPVVCTDSGGPPEYVEDGVTGFVVPAEDPAAMAATIGALLDDPVLRRRCGRHGRAQAEALYRYSRMIDDIVCAYRLVTRDRAPPKHVATASVIGANPEAN